MSQPCIYLLLFVVNRHAAASKECLENRKLVVVGVGIGLITAHHSGKRVKHSIVATENGCLVRNRRAVGSAFGALGL